MTVERKFDAKSMLGMLRRYEATVGDLFAVVPPLMSRDSVKAADIDGVTLRRISVKDLMEGILMPEEKVEGGELIRVDAAKSRPQLFAYHRHCLVYHHLRSLLQTVFGTRLHRDAKQGRRHKRAGDR